MIGATIRDIIETTYECRRIKCKDFELFSRGSEVTDDSIITTAVGDALIDWFCFGGDMNQSS